MKKCLGMVEVLAEKKDDYIRFRSRVKLGFVVSMSKNFSSVSIAELWARTETLALKVRDSHFSGESCIMLKMSRCRVAALMISMSCPCVWVLRGRRDLTWTR